MVKIITDVAIARRLIKLGNIVVDIMPRRDNPIATVFVFEENEKLLNDEQKIIQSIQLNKKS